MRYDNTNTNNNNNNKNKKQMIKLSKYAYLDSVNFTKIKSRIHVPNRVGENHEPVIG